MTCLSEAIFSSFPPPRGTREHPESYRLWMTAQDQEIRGRKIYVRPPLPPAQNACKNTKGGNLNVTMLMAKLPNPDAASRLWIRRRLMYRTTLGRGIWRIDRTCKFPTTKKTSKFIESGCLCCSMWVSCHHYFYNCLLSISVVSVH